MAVRTFFSLLTETYNEWSEDKVPRLGAALAYYSVFSIARKSIDASRARKDAETKALALKEKQTALSDKLGSLQTPAGQESALREQFPLVKLARGDEAFSLLFNGDVVALENIYRVASPQSKEDRRVIIKRWVVELLRAAEGSTAAARSSRGGFARGNRREPRLSSR